MGSCFKNCIGIGFLGASEGGLVKKSITIGVSALWYKVIGSSALLLLLQFSRALLKAGLIKSLKLFIDQPKKALKSTILWYLKSIFGRDVDI